MHLNAPLLVVVAGKQIVRGPGATGWLEWFQRQSGLGENECGFKYLVFVVILYFHHHRAVIRQAAISKWILAFNFPAVGDSAISRNTNGRGRNFGLTFCNQNVVELTPSPTEIVGALRVGLKVMKSRLLLGN